MNIWRFQSVPECLIFVEPDELTIRKRSSGRKTILNFEKTESGRKTLKKYAFEMRTRPGRLSISFSLQIENFQHIFEFDQSLFENE